MTRTEQRTFIRELISNVKEDLLSNVSSVPDTWDGHELRQWIADRFAESSFSLKQNKRRYRDYRNVISTTPGL
jgi:hypothetical protein